ncbi:DUF4198 domain-containing protein [Rhodobacteraceae bacterium RKSG542]|uniref:DUF4198 domain-containing protein n=1 Tax=Pseudovibrio flavus TaxID=2529854 RepID=UPI0012BCC37A|nr:DUF4198 domain-containing protein [Pseudovibrio flavus]MTI17476.1 DUF4198 domain-containing protein [Pseudovibrio flavus]
MKKILLGAALISAVAMGSAQAHFQLLYTPEVMLDAPAEIDLKLVFGHPMENGHVMDMGEPEAFNVFFKGKSKDLLSTLKPITWKGPHNDAKAYEASYKVKRNGDYIFTFTPAPYLEEGEGVYIQQITKSFVNKAGLPTGWNEPVGLVTEIVPLNKPYQNYVGGTFTGQVLSEGKPAAGVECEIEYINPLVEMDANAFGKEAGPKPATAMVAITDANGMFTFGIPRAGNWGFACLGSGPAKEFNGKELSQDAVLWINATEFK